MDGFDKTQSSLQVWHFLAIIVATIYFQIPFIRILALDILFGSMIAYCVYVAVVSFKRTTRKTTKENEETLSKQTAADTKKAHRHVYPIEFIRQLSIVSSDEEKRGYSIIIKASESTLRYSPNPRGRTPEVHSYSRNHTPDPIDFVTHNPYSRLAPEEERDFVQTMKELTPDFVSLSREELPKDIQMGKVHWLKKNSGRIHVAKPILGLKDIFFHIRDCEIEDGDEIRLGDSVMFEISEFDNRICAIRVKKMGKQGIPSPDFSRRTLKHSKQDLPHIEELKL